MECGSVNENGSFGPQRPVKEGDVVEVEVSSEGKKGDGVARYKNFVVFVKGGKKGKKYEVKITEVKHTFAVGEIVNEV